MADQLAETLQAASQADRQAELKLEEWLQKNYCEFGRGLAAALADESKLLEVRQAASIYLKNTLAAKSATLQQEKHNRWKTLDAAARQPIKEMLLAAMRSPVHGVPHIAAVAAAEVASVELPFNEWPQFVPAMMENARPSQTAPDGQPQQTAESISLAALECLGFTCERIAEVEEMLPGENPELPVATVDSMLTTIVDGVQANRSEAVRLRALQALRNSLQFVRKNMEVKQERDFLMTAVCEATRSADPGVRRQAYNCMDFIAEIYYEKLPDYMKVIFQLTTEAIQTDQDEDVKKAAIEFWTTLSYMEQQFLDEEQQYREEGMPLDRPACPKYVQAAMEQLVPLLLQALTQQEEDSEEDTFNLQAAGGICLEAISQTVESLIVPVVIPFVQQHINSEEWRLRDAAINAFSSILEGPSTEAVGTYVHQSIPVLLTAFNDQHVMVRDSATHCISKICRLHIAAVQPDMVHSIIGGLMNKLSEAPLVASHACSAIYNISASLKPPTGEPAETNLLSAPMLPLMQNLLKAADREDAVEAHLRVACMGAAAELVSAAANDVLHIHKELLPEIGRRMGDALKMPVVSNDDREIKDQLLGLLAGLVTALFQRLDKASAMPSADAIMELLLQILQVGNATCHEEALLSVGAIAICLEEDFVKYLQAFMPSLVGSIRSVQQAALCKVAVGVVVDVCGAVGAQVQPYCDEIMSALMDILKDASASRDIKPTVISCFGDVALAIGAAYQPYLQLSVMLLMQASQQQAMPDNEDFLQFINTLRLCILEAYSGIIVGLADGNALHLFLPNVPSVATFLQFLATAESLKDEEVLQKAVLLIGDIFQTMGTTPQVQQLTTQQWTRQLLQEAMASNDESVRSNAAWAQSELQKVLMQQQQQQVPQQA